jgi:hypothetical protein
MTKDRQPVTKENLSRRLATARCALFPLPEGEGQGEGNRRELPSAYRAILGTVDLR